MNETELPPFSLDVQALDLGADVNAIGLQLLETESRDPARGKEAAELWAAVLPALANGEELVLDFFSHVDRVKEFCAAKQISYREAGARCMVLRKLTEEQLRQLAERFEGESFGVRAGAAAEKEDPALEGELSKRGMDAYHTAYGRYSFCAVCELEDGWVTVLSATLWPSEIIRRLRPAVQRFDVHIARPQ
jgi:hypothetical protein